MKPARPASDALHITAQYRTKLGKCYELTRSGEVLAVHILPPSERLPQGNWEVEVRLGTDAGPSIAGGRGASAEEAMLQTARVWPVQGSATSAFDWDAVTRELRAVRAM